LKPMNTIKLTPYILHPLPQGDDAWTALRAILAHAQLVQAQLAEAKRQLGCAIDVLSVLALERGGELRIKRSHIPTGFRGVNTKTRGDEVVVKFCGSLEEINAANNPD
jgi:hypothetical protein